MRDRQILLAMRDYTLGIDETQAFTVSLQEALANFDLLQVYVEHADLTQTVYDILLGEQPIAMQGETIYIAASIVNNGGDGDCFIEILLEGTLLWTWTGFLVTGESSGVMSAAVGNLNPFTMPANPVALTANAGH